MRRRETALQPLLGWLLIMASLFLSACARVHSLRPWCSGNFSLTCGMEKVEALTGTLSAYCMDGFGAFHESTLTLNDHIMNDNGLLRCNSGGGQFAESCFGFTIRAYGDNAGLLEATCVDLNNDPVPAALDLNMCVRNTLGTLSWYCL